MHLARNDTSICNYVCTSEREAKSWFIQQSHQPGSHK